MKEEEVARIVYNLWKGYRVLANTFFSRHMKQRLSYSLFSENVG